MRHISLIMVKCINFYFNIFNSSSFLSKYSNSLIFQILYFVSVYQCFHMLVLCSKQCIADIFHLHSVKILYFNWIAWNFLLKASLTVFLWWTISSATVHFIFFIQFQHSLLSLASLSTTYSCVLHVHKEDKFRWDNNIQI